MSNLNDDHRMMPNNNSIPSGAVEPSTQTRILEAALDEFAEHGFAGARVDRIAKAAGVNKAMLYYHFGSKDALYEKAVGAHIAAIVAALGDNLTGTEDFEAILSGVAETYVRVFGGDQRVRRLLLRELANPRGQLLDMIAGIFRDSGIPTTVLGILQRGMRDGKFRVLDPRQALVSFVIMNIGYFLMAPVFDRVLQIGDRERFVAERKKAIVDIFLNGVKAG